MCIGMLPALLMPTAGVRLGARAMGLDSTTSNLVSGDIIGALGSKKEREKEAKAEQKNQEAWNNYYASRRNKPASPFTMYSNRTEER